MLIDEKNIKDVRNGFYGISAIMHEDKVVWKQQNEIINNRVRFLYRVATGTDVKSIEVIIDGKKSNIEKMRRINVNSTKLTFALEIKSRSSRDKLSIRANGKTIYNGDIDFNIVSKPYTVNLSNKITNKIIIDVGYIE